MDEIKVGSFIRDLSRGIFFDCTAFGRFIRNNERVHILAYGCVLFSFWMRVFDPFVKCICYRFVFIFSSFPALFLYLFWFSFRPNSIECALLLYYIYRMLKRLCFIVFFPIKIRIQLRGIISIKAYCCNRKFNLIFLGN